MALQPSGLSIISEREIAGSIPCQAQTCVHFSKYFRYLINHDNLLAPVLSHLPPQWKNLEHQNRR